jgi:DNA repair protein RAD57
MQLTRSITSKFPNSKSVLISTEGYIETKRLVEINPNLDDVLTINCMDLETQEHIFNVQLPSLLSKQDIKLVVIDSISHHLRVEFENDFKKLKKKLIELTLNLLSLSIKHNFAIVVTNQISDKPVKKILDTDYKKLNIDYQIGWLNGWKESDILERQNYDESSGEYSGNSKISTMGLNWDQFVDVKILLLKSYKINNLHKNDNATRDRGEKNALSTELNDGVNNEGALSGNYWVARRFFKLVYSNRSTDSSKIEFTIDKNGISCL